MTQPEPAHADDAAGLRLDADWSSASAVPVVPANAFLSQIGANAGTGRPDGIYLVAGHAEPPIVYGSDEQRAAALERLRGVANITVHARLFLTRDRAAELAQLLSDAVDQYDQLDPGRGEGDSDA